MPKAIREKDELYWSVLNVAVTLDIRHGHLKWKISELARLSKVNRTLIYYYFGKSKGAILHEAVRLFGDELAGATPERQAMWKDGKMNEALQLNRVLLAKIPAIIPFYFLNREASSDVGVAIREREDAFFKKINAFFPTLSNAEKKGIFALFFGILFVPEIVHADPSKGIDLILKATR